MKKTVKQLTQDLEAVKQDMGNVHISSGIMWNTTQIKEFIDEHDKQNEIIKVEIRHSFEPGKKYYMIDIWHYPKLRDSD